MSLEVPSFAKPLLHPISPTAASAAKIGQQRFGTKDQFIRAPYAGIPLSVVDDAIAKLNQEMKSTADPAKKAFIAEFMIKRLQNAIAPYMHSSPEIKEMRGELDHELENAGTTFQLHYVLPIIEEKPIAPNFNEAFENRLKACKQMVENFNTLVATGLGKTPKTPLQIWQMVHETLGTMAEEKGIKLKVDGFLPLAFSREGFKACSNIRFYSLLMNLVQNALKYTPSNGTVNIKFAEEPILQSQTDALKIEVTDQGIGILPDDHEKVLQGERGSNALASDIPGTGFGLSKIERIVRNASGKLQIESPLQPEKPNPGTRMTCWLPLKESD